MSKTAQGLVDYCKAQVGRPYWYGTYGQIATEELYKKKKKQYWDYYCWANDYEEQFGQKVHDCHGLIEGYLMSESADAEAKRISEYDRSANGAFRDSKEKGDIDTILEIPGLCVYKSGHTGIYIGDGKVIEARGHKYGVVITDIKDRGWTHWYKHPDIEYKTKYEAYVKVALPVLVKGDKTPDVGVMQNLLLYNGYSVGNSGVDCSFGGDTQRAIKSLQYDHKLPISGKCGAQEWTVLLSGE